MFHSIGSLLRKISTFTLSGSPPLAYTGSGKCGFAKQLGQTNLQCISGTGSKMRTGFLSPRDLLPPYIIPRLTQQNLSSYIYSLKAPWLSSHEEHSSQYLQLFNRLCYATFFNVTSCLRVGYTSTRPYHYSPNNTLDT